MDWKKQKLVEKYWKGETTLAEEKTLSQLTLHHDAAYFKMLDLFAKQQLPKDFDELLLSKLESKTRRRMWQCQPWFNIAAMLVLGVSIALGSAYHIRHQREQEEVRVAFEKSKNALMMVASRLRKGSRYTQVSLSQLEETQQKIVNID